MPLTEILGKSSLWWINLLALQTFSEDQALVLDSILNLIASVHDHQ